MIAETMEVILWRESRHKGGKWRRAEIVFTIANGITKAIREETNAW